MARRPDVLHYHALGPGLLAFLPRALSSSGVVLTVHGLDHQRAKWGSTARAVLRAGEWLSARVPDATIVVSRALADHYRARHRREPWVVPNGVEPRPARPPREIVPRLGLRPRSYLLFVGRLVPEKAPDLLIRAFGRLPGDLRLVIAGGSSFTDGFVRALREKAAGDRRVVLAGYVYGSLLEELYSNAAAFVLPSTVEGLPLTLLEAASYGTPVVASDIPPHREILGADRPGARTFPPGDEDGLARVLARVLGDLPGERRGGAALGRAVVRRYGWDQAVDTLERVYRTVVG
jgi:glycosyltransferase involved in cell wall biosynthesis